MALHSMKDVSKTDKFRVAIYGKPGTGKTSTAKYLTGKSIIVPFDNSEKVLGGLDNIEAETFDKSIPTKELARLVTELPKELTGFNNLILDNVSALEKAWFIEQGRNSKSGIRNELQDYSGWTNFFIRVIDSFYKLPINILVTAWETQNDFTSMTGQTFDQYSPQLRDSVRDTFMGLTDVVGRVMVNPDTGKHGVILEGNDGIYAKNRLDDRKACAIEDLFKWGDSDVQTSRVSNEASESSKTEAK